MKKRCRITFSARLACVLAALLVLLSGCAPSPDRLLDYQNGEKTAELSGRIGELEFSATLALSSHVEGEERAFELRMHSPQSLAGMTFERGADGKITATLGELSVELSESKRSLAVRLADTFSLVGEPERISVVSGVDEGLTQYERLMKADFPDVTVFIDSESGLPVKIVSLDLEVFVRSFDEKRN